MSVYSRLGIRTIINANTSLTRLGGTLMDREVADVMRDAATAFVDMFELQEAVDARLAALTRNEDALVCAGAASGITLATLACMTGPSLQEIARLVELGPHALTRNKVVMQRAHRIPYDPAVRLAGADIVEVGNVLQTFDWQMEAALDEGTAAILHIEGAFLPPGGLPLDRVIRIARDANIPVIVDAAAQQLPKENLWRFTEAGADAAIFSGGKGLRGPQCSGLIVGKKALVRACAMHASPNQRLGRAMKVGKEEIVGLLVAVERFLEGDVDQELARNESILEGWADALASLPGVHVTRLDLNAGGQPIPRLRLQIGDPVALDAHEIGEGLRTGEPRIDIEVAGPDVVFLAAECLKPGEEVWVQERLLEILTEGRGDGRSSDDSWRLSHDPQSEERNRCAACGPSSVVRPARAWGPGGWRTRSTAWTPSIVLRAVKSPLPSRTRSTLEDVKNQLGHSSIVLTSNTYGHVLDQRQPAAAMGMEGLGLRDGVRHRVLPRKTEARPIGELREADRVHREILVGHGSELCACRCHALPPRRRWWSPCVDPSAGPAQRRGPSSASAGIGRSASRRR